MSWITVVAVYFLFWVLSAFLVLPFIAAKRQRGENDPRVPGQADSAPTSFPLWRVILYTTIVSAVLYGLFTLNYEFGWVTPDMLDYFN